MALTRWKTLSEATVLENDRWTYKCDRYELPSGKIGEYHYVHTNGSSMIVPVTSDRRFLTVKQYRYLMRRESIEFPCGSVEGHATYEDTARHELEEETGYAAGRIVMVGTFNPYNGMTDEMCHVFIAEDLQYVGATPDETEEFELLPLTQGEIEDLLRNGTIWDGMTMAAWCLARSRIGQA